MIGFVTYVKSLGNCYNAQVVVYDHFIRNGMLFSCLFDSLGLSSIPSGRWRCSDCTKGEVGLVFIIIIYSTVVFTVNPMLQTIN